MSVKLSTRQVGDVSVVDVAGRITLGEGSSALRENLRDMVSKNQKKILLNLGGCFLYRQLGDRRAGIGLYHRDQQRRAVEAAQPQQAGEGPAADHQAVYRLRRSRRRSPRHPQLYVDVGGMDDRCWSSVNGVAPGRGMTDHGRRWSVLPAAHELDDFDLCAGFDHGPAPLRLFDDAAVEFDGDARGIESQTAAADPSTVCCGATVRISPLMTMWISIVG